MRHRIINKWEDNVDILTSCFTIKDLGRQASENTISAIFIFNLTLNWLITDFKL